MPTHHHEIVDLGATLRDHRERRSISQQAVADRLGCTPQKVSLIENGRRALKVSDVEAYASAIGERLLIELRAEEGSSALEDLHHLVAGASEVTAAQLLRVAQIFARMDEATADREITILEARVGLVDIPRRPPPARREQAR